MDLLRYLPESFFHWCETSTLAILLKQGYAFAVIETIHILGLTVLIGTIVIVDLRLLKLILPSESISSVAREIAPWTIGSTILTILAGAGLFITEATKLGSDEPFFIKMVCLFLALVVHFTIYRKATKPNAMSSDGWNKIVVGLSLSLWVCVALAGRAIAFL